MTVNQYAKHIARLLNNPNIKYKDIVNEMWTDDITRQMIRRTNEYGLVHDDKWKIIPVALPFATTTVKTTVKKMCNNTDATSVKWLTEHMPRDSFIQWTKTVCFNEADHQRDAGQRYICTERFEDTIKEGQM